MIPGLLRRHGLAAAALAVGLALASGGRADPAISTWGWILSLGQHRFTAADPEPDTWVCHDDVHLEEAGGHPEFHIEITGDCAFVPPDFNPDAGSFSPQWIDVTWKGTYDYATGQGSEKLRRHDGGTLYDVDLDCPPGQNPFIHTVSCSVRIGPGGNSPSDARGSPPLSGGHLDGFTRQNLIAWEQQQGAPQEGEGMDLAPNADPPRFVSPIPGGSFPNGVQVVLRPSARGVPISTEYELEFYFERPFPPQDGGMVMKRADPGPRVLTQREPELTRTLDTVESPQGLSLSLNELGRMGHWTVRARMASTPGAEWSAPVAFTSGFEARSAEPASPSGIGPVGEKKRGMARERTLQRTGPGAAAVQEDDEAGGGMLQKQGTPSRRLEAR